SSADRENSGRRNGDPNDRADRQVTAERGAVEDSGLGENHAAHGVDLWRNPMDFGPDRVRVLTVLDTCTRECVALEAATRFTGQQVADVLTRVGVEPGLPTTIAVDYGTEFTSKALDHWACRNNLKLDYTRRGKPTDDGSIESFNARVRSDVAQASHLSIPKGG